MATDPGPPLLHLLLNIPKVDIGHWDKPVEKPMSSVSGLITQKTAPKQQRMDSTSGPNFTGEYISQVEQFPYLKARCKGGVSSLSTPRAGRQLEVQVQVFHDTCHSQRTPFQVYLTQEAKCICACLHAKLLQSCLIVATLWL